MSLTYPWVSYPFEFLRNRTQFNGIHKSRMERRINYRKANVFDVSFLFQILFLLLFLSVYDEIFVVWCLLWLSYRRMHTT